MKAKGTVESTTREQYQAACRRLSAALDMQSKEASAPSINVSAAIAHVLAYDIGWRVVLGNLVAESMQAWAAEHPEVLDAPA